MSLEKLVQGFVLSQSPEMLAIAQEQAAYEVQVLQLCSITAKTPDEIKTLARTSPLSWSAWFEWAKYRALRGLPITPYDNKPSPA